MLLWATLLIVVAPLFFTNCSNDPEMDAVPPVFKEVVINPTSVQAGKSVNATLKIQSMGKSYTIKGEGSSLDMKEPTFTIPIPSEAPTGRYTLRINQITVEASTLFANGSPFGASTIESNSVNLTVTE